MRSRSSSNSHTPLRYRLYTCPYLALINLLCGLTDKISGKEFKREGLAACMDYLRSGDTLVIYRLDQFGRSVKEMLDLCAKLEMRRIKLVALQYNLDTFSAVGRFTMQILASLAEYNRNLILEGCKAGIRGSPKTGCQVRETGRYQDEEAKEGSRHPAL